MKKYVRVRSEPNTFDKKRSIATEHPKVPAGHGRVSAKVAYDITISDCDYRIYTILTVMERGGIVTAGLRLVAQAAGKSISTVSLAIHRLAAKELIEIRAGAKRGERASYRLTSPIFSKRSPLGAGSGAPDVSISAQPIDTKELPGGAHTCSKCSRQLKRLPTSGLCRGCAEDLELPVRIEQAKAVLGANATPDEIASHMKNRKLAAKIRSILYFELCPQARRLALQ